MSRFCADNDSGDLPAIFWQIDLERALTSGRGQRILRDIKAGLLAMPVRELIEGDIVRYDPDEQEGSVCLVGAYAAWRKVQAGSSWAAAFAELAERWAGDRDEWETQQCGQEQGLARTVAYELAWRNDEMWGALNPKQRWMAAYWWICSMLEPGHAMLGIEDASMFMYACTVRHSDGQVLHFEADPLRVEAEHLAYDMAVAAACGPVRPPVWMVPA